MLTLRLKPCPKPQKKRQQFKGRKAAISDRALKKETLASQGKRFQWLAFLFGCSIS